MTVTFGPRIISEHQDALVKVSEVANLDDKQFRALVYMATLGFDAQQPPLDLTSDGKLQLTAPQIFSSIINTLSGDISKSNPARLTAAKELLHGIVHTHMDDANSFELRKNYSDPDPATYPRQPSDSDYMQRSKLTDPLEKLGITFVDSRPLPLWANPMAMREVLFGAIVADEGGGPVRPLTPKERRAALTIVADKAAKLES